VNDQFKASRLVLESTKHYLVSGGKSPQHKICRCVNLITKLYLVPSVGVSRLPLLPNMLRLNN